MSPNERRARVAPRTRQTTTAITPGITHITGARGDVNPIRTDVGEQIAAAAFMAQRLVDQLAARDTITVDDIRRIRKFVDSCFGNAMVAIAAAQPEAAI
jgi:hypothetical protein